MELLFKELPQLIRAEGPLLVECLIAVELLDGYPESGLRAWLSDAEVTGDNVQICLNFSEFDAYNRMHETANYYNPEGGPALTARQMGEYREVQYYAVNALLPVASLFTVLAPEVVALHENFMGQNETQDYVTWLESQLISNKEEL